jgi:hypothetical protein
MFILWLHAIVMAFVREVHGGEGQHETMVKLMVIDVVIVSVWMFCWVPQ